MRSATFATLGTLARPAALATFAAGALLLIALSPEPLRAAGIPANGTPGDWQQFGYDPRHSGTAALETTLRPGDVGTLHLLYSVSLPGTVDDAPVFLSGVSTPGGVRDVLYVTTTDGQLVAVDAATGGVLWSRQPATGPPYTTSAPAIDPGRPLV